MKVLLILFTCISTSNSTHTSPRHFELKSRKTESIREPFSLFQIIYILTVKSTNAPHRLSLKIKPCQTVVTFCMLAAQSEETPLSFITENTGPWKCDHYVISKGQETPGDAEPRPRKRRLQVCKTLKLHNKKQKCRHYIKCLPFRIFKMVWRRHTVQPTVLAMYVESNTEARSCKYCCSGKAMSITQP